MKQQTPVKPTEQPAAPEPAEQPPVVEPAKQPPVPEPTALRGLDVQISGSVNGEQRINLTAFLDRVPSLALRAGLEESKKEYLDNTFNPILQQLEKTPVYAAWQRLIGQVQEAKREAEDINSRLAEAKRKAVPGSVTVAALGAVKALEADAASAAEIVGQLEGLRAEARQEVAELRKRMLTAAVQEARKDLNSRTAALKVKIGQGLAEELPGLQLARSIGYELAQESTILAKYGKLPEDPADGGQAGDPQPGEQRPSDDSGPVPPRPQPHAKQERAKFRV